MNRGPDFLDRLSGSLVGKYPNKIEAYTFTDPALADAFVKEAKPDVLLADSFFDFNPQTLPANCTFAWLVDTQGVDVWKDRKAIFKYQKVEAIYKWFRTGSAGGM